MSRRLAPWDAAPAPAPRRGAERALTAALAVAVGVVVLAGVFVGALVLPSVSGVPALLAVVVALALAGVVAASGEWLRRRAPRIAPPPLGVGILAGACLGGFFAVLVILIAYSG